MESHLDIATDYVSVAHAYAALTADPRTERRRLPGGGGEAADSMQDCLAMASNFASISDNYSVLTARDAEDGRPDTHRPAEEHGRQRPERAEEEQPRRRPGRRPGEEELPGLERPLPSQLHDPFSSAMADVADTYYTVTGMQGISNSSFAVTTSYADIAAKLDALTSGMDITESGVDAQDLRRMSQAGQGNGLTQTAQRVSAKAASEVVQGLLGRDGGAPCAGPEDLSVTGDSVLEPEPDCEPMGAMGSTQGSLNFGSPR